MDKESNCSQGKDCRKASDGIIHHNEGMCGADRSNQLAAYYPCERKTMQWSAKLTYISFTEKHGKKLKLLEFKDRIIEASIKPPYSIVPTPRADKIHLPTKDTQYVCPDCPGKPGLCLEECCFANTIIIHSL